MSNEIRPNRVQSSEMSGGAAAGGKSNTMVIAIVVVVVLAIVGFLFKDKLMGGSGSTGGSMSIGTKSNYQSVFLTNGQVYFGKLADFTDTYVTLTDVYYLQVSQAPIQGSKEQQAQAQPQISLVKLGSELHGPLDEMKINRSQVLFFEDMKEESQVVKAIRSYQKNPPAQGGTQSVPQGGTTGGTTQTPATTGGQTQTPASGN